jgi:putative sterol carrier protein
MSAAFVSEPWIAELARLGAQLPVVAGATMSIQHEIAGAPDGKVRFHMQWTDGTLAHAELGKVKEPDIVIQAKAPEALRIISGDLDPDVAYMQGRLKVDGDYRRFLIDLRDWRASEPYQQLIGAMAAFTEPL